MLLKLQLRKEAEKGKEIAANQLVHIPSECTQTIRLKSNKERSISKEWHCAAVLVGYT